MKHLLLSLTFLVLPTISQASDIANMTWQEILEDPRLAADFEEIRFTFRGVDYVWLSPKDFCKDNKEKSLKTIQPVEICEYQSSQRRGHFTCYNPREEHINFPLERIPKNWQNVFVPIYRIYRDNHKVFITERLYEYPICQ